MDKHVKSITIKNFKGIKQLELNDLNQINIIVGDNNIGKTNLLETIYLLQSPHDFNNIISLVNYNISNFKVTNKLANVRNLFNNSNANYSFEIQSNIGDDLVSLKLTGIFKEVFTGKLTTNVNEQTFVEDVLFDDRLNYNKTDFSNKILYKISYLRSIDYILNNNIDSIIKNIEYKKLCIEMLKLFDSDIEDILLTKDGSYLTEYIKHKKKGIMPLNIYGDGIKKVLSLSNAIIKANNGILLIDEIETSIHSKYHDDIFKFIIKAAKNFNIQLFITTHSIEALDGLLLAQDYENNIEDIINVITLRKDQKSNQVLTRTLKGKEVMDNRNSFDFEVRV